MQRQQGRYRSLQLSVAALILAGCVVGCHDDPEVRACAQGRCDVDGDGHMAMARGGRDCDDNNPDVHPDAVEICNGIDDDCDGLADDADTQGGPADAPTRYLDRDDDGVGDEAFPLARCTAGVGVAEIAGDCSDRDPAVYPGAPEDPCNDTDDNCDGVGDNPYECGYCPEPDTALAASVEMHWETWNPCLLDPTTTILCDPETDTHEEGERLHTVGWRTDEGYWQPSLLVFLPPGPGDSNNLIRRWAAYTGMRVISLGFPNDGNLSHDCRSPNGDTCWLNSRTETLYGEDLSPFVDVSPQDSMSGRLATVLSHLVVEHPDMAFDQHLHPDGTVDWSQIVLMGWSFGGAQAGFTAKFEPVRGAIMLSSPKDQSYDLGPSASWTSMPSATPGCALYGTWHAEENFTDEPLDVLGMAYDGMGMPAAQIDMDASPGWPPAGTHRISQSNPEADMLLGCDAHAAVGNDRCMRPEQHAPYVYLMCAAAHTDPDCK